MKEFQAIFHTRVVIIIIMAVVVMTTDDSRVQHCTIIIIMQPEDFYPHIRPLNLFKVKISDAEVLIKKISTMIYTSHSSSFMLIPKAARIYNVEAISR